MSERLTGVAFEFDPTDLANPTLAFLRSYWDVKRAGRLMPSRADIRVPDLKEHLGWLMLVEVLNGMSEFRFRLEGTLVKQYFLGESDATGKTVKEVMAVHGPAATKAVEAIFRKVARDRKPARAYGNAGWIADNYEAFDALYLPLSDDGETVNMILHAFVFDRASVLIARAIAKANGGRLLHVPPEKRAEGR
jgi:hypothetical protein